MKPAAFEKPEPLPAEAGYAGKPGQAANLIGNFLHGWMAGKDVSEQKMRQKAQYEVGAAWNTYQQAQQRASDPSLSQEDRQVAAQNIGKAYNLWLDTIGRYVGPDQGQGKKGGKKQGIMGRLGGAFKAEKPQLATEDLLALYRNPAMVKMMTTPQGPTAEQQKQQIELQQARRLEDTAKQVDEKTKSLNTILEKGANLTDDDRANAVNTLTQIQALQGNLKDIPDPRADQAKKTAEQATAKLQAQMSTDALSAYDKKQRGLPLSPTEERLLSAYLPEGKTDPFTIYQNMIGKRTTNKLTGKPVDVKDDHDAMDLYLSDQAYWAKVGRNPTEYEMQSADTKAAIRSKLRIDLGHEPTDDEIKSKWLDLTTGPKVATEKPRNIPTAEKAAIQQSVYRDLAVNDRWKRFTDVPDSKTGLVRILPRSRFNKDDQKEYDNMMNEIGSQLADHGLSAEDIREVTGSAGFGQYQMGATPGVTHAGPTKKYRVRRGNESVEQEMTADEVAALKKAYPNWTVEESAP